MAKTGSAEAFIEEGRKGEKEDMKMEMEKGNFLGKLEEVGEKKKSWVRAALEEREEE